MGYLSYYCPKCGWLGSRAGKLKICPKCFGDVIGTLAIKRRLKQSRKKTR